MKFWGLFFFFNMYSFKKQEGEKLCQPRISQWLGASIGSRPPGPVPCPQSPLFLPEGRVSAPRAQARHLPDQEQHWPLRETTVTSSGHCQTLSRERRSIEPRLKHLLSSYHFYTVIAKGGQVKHTLSRCCYIEGQIIAVNFTRVELRLLKNRLAGRNAL